MCVRCDWGARGGKGTVPEGGHSMKHIRIASFALALLLLAALLPFGVFSAKAEGEATITVETRAGQNESVEVSETVTTDADGVKTTEHAAEDYTTASGMIVDYTGKNVEYPDGLYAFEDHWTAQDANDTYEAEGGSDKSNEYRAPATEIGILIGEDDVGKTNTVPGPAVGVIETTGDVKENDADGIYDYTTTERITQSVVNVTTKSMEITDAHGEVNPDDMEYLHTELVATADKEMLDKKGNETTNMPRLSRPTSPAEVPTITDGYQYVILGSDQFSKFWAAYLYLSPATEPDPANDNPYGADEEPIYQDENYSFYARRRHAAFGNLKFNEYYLPNRQVVNVVGEDGKGLPLRWDMVEFYTLSDANANLISAYCADQFEDEDKGFCYNILNLEDASYYSEEEAEHIRAIGKKGYWGQESGQGSLEALQQTMRDSGEFTDAEIVRVTPGIAMHATQIAIWSYSNVMDDIAFLHAHKVKYYLNSITGNTNAAGPADEEEIALIMKLYYFLYDLEPEVIPSGSNTTENTIINEKNFLKSVSFTITGKPEDHANNQDADKTNDVYTVDLEIAFKVKPLEENGDDLVLEIQDQNGDTIVKARIAGPIQDGEVPATVISDGVYKIEGIQLQEGETALKFALSGTQNLENDVYFFESECREDPNPKNRVSQPMVGIAKGKRDVNIWMDISFELDVTDEEVKKEHIWRTEEKIPHYVDIPVEKEWKDGKNADGVRPESITVRLLADGVEVDSATVTPNENGDWNYTFKNLPKYTEDGTREIKYTITEDEVPEYTTEIDQGTYTITNKHGPETVEKTVTKEWDDAENVDGVRPESITVHLLADGKEVASATITPDEDGKWEYTFTDLPKNREGGGEIEYTVTEDPVPEYEAEIENLHITNKHVPETVEIPIEKKWDDEENRDGVRPESITVRLYADGEEVASAEVKPDENGDWTYTFTDLPKYKEQGVEIEYTVDEDPVSAYEKSVDGYVITNKHVSERIDIEGKKTWDDEDDKNEMRPVKITIRLFADGNEIDAKTVTEKDGWAWKWEDLPKYKDGKEIKYTIKEDRVKSYLTKIEGFDVTNTYTTQTGDVMQPWLWIALLGVALLLGGGLLALEWISRRTE